MNGGRARRGGGQTAHYNRTQIKQAEYIRDGNCCLTASVMYVNTGCIAVRALHAGNGCWHDIQIDLYPRGQNRLQYRRSLGIKRKEGQPCRPNHGIVTTTTTTTAATTATTTTTAATTATTTQTTTTTPHQRITALPSKDRQSHRQTALPATLSLTRLLECNFHPKMSHFRSTSLP